MYLDWSIQDRAVYAIDIETESLTPDIIWCMCWENLKTGEVGDCIGLEAIKSFFVTTRGSYYVGHNILKFDGPVLVRLADVRLGVGCLIDTLVLSTLYSPSLYGGHSLGEWGQRLGLSKGDFNDFSHFSPEMLSYCRQDVKITGILFKRLIKTLQRIGFSERSIWIQHRFTVILERQRRNGFYFDYERGLSLYQTLRSKQSELEELIHVAFPPTRVHVARRTLRKQDQGYTSIYLKDRDRYVIEECPDGYEYDAYEDVPFNVGSPKQRVDKLCALGWRPEEFTPAGGAKPFDKGKLSPSLERFLETTPTPEVELIAKWMSVNGRGNMVNTWLNEWSEDTGCIHGKLFVADTLRLRHQAPNTANIPAVRTRKDAEGREHVLYGDDGYYTYEARDLWCARPNRVLVGTDAAGLELRMLAHYLNRPEFTEVVIGGDPHQFNADTVGISRTLAKTLLYAIQYGAQPKKVASIIGCSLSEGKKVREEFLERLGLKGVMDDAIHEQRQGRIELVDGSRIVCPSEHSALNYRLQGGGARVMALAAIFLERYIREDGLDSLKVGDIHDEWQYDCHPRDSKRHAIRSVQAIRDAGEELGLNVSLDGTAKEGKTWAETH